MKYQRELEFVARVRAAFFWCGALFITIGVGMSFGWWLALGVVGTAMILWTTRN